MKKERIAIFGGTFAPPHMGHVHVVETVLKKVTLDRMMIIPTAIPPHKEKAAGDTPAQRLEMCRAAFGDLPKTEISSYEIDKGGLSYSVDTLEHFSSPERMLFLVCGSDMFESLPTWFKAERIFELATIVCVPRCRGDYERLQCFKDEFTRRYSAKVRLLGTNPFEMSSTEIRNRIVRSESLDGILPPKVMDIIMRDGLYKNTEL